MFSVFFPFFRFLLYPLLAIFLPLFGLAILLMLFSPEMLFLFLSSVRIPYAAVGVCVQQRNSTFSSCSACVLCVILEVGARCTPDVFLLLFVPFRHLLFVSYSCFCVIFAVTCTRFVHSSFPSQIPSVSRVSLSVYVHLFTFGTVYPSSNQPHLVLSESVDERPSINHPINQYVLNYVYFVWMMTYAGLKKGPSEREPTARGSRSSRAPQARDI